MPWKMVGTWEMEWQEWSRAGKGSRSDCLGLHPGSTLNSCVVFSKLYNLQFPRLQKRGGPRAVVLQGVTARAGEPIDLLPT